MKLRFAAVVFIILLMPVISSAQNATLEITQGTLNRMVNRLGILSDSGTYQPMISVELPGVTICHFVGFMECAGLSGMNFGFEGLEIPPDSELPSAPGGEFRPGTPDISPMDFGFEGDRLPLAICETVGGGYEVLPAGEPVFWQWWVTKAYFTLNSGSMTFSAEVYTRIADTRNVTADTVSASVSYDSSVNRLKINIADFKVPIQYLSKTADEVDVAKLYSISIPIEPQTITVPMLDGTQKSVTARAVAITPHYLFGEIKVDINVDF